MDDLSDAKIRNAVPADKLFGAAAKHGAEKSKNGTVKSAATCSRRCHSALVPSAADGSIYSDRIAVSRDTTTFPMIHSGRSDVPANLDKAFARVAAVQPAAGL